jgi:Tol biopolymer transport system component
MMKHTPAKFLFTGLITLILLSTILGACTTEDGGQPPANPPPSTLTTATVVTEEIPAQVTPAAAEVTIPPDTGSGPETAAAGPELSGSLYYIGVVGDGVTLFALDLAGGVETAIFSPPENAWLSEIALSPDGSQILLAYSPPPEEGQVQYGFTDLYLMPADGSAGPELLLEGADPSESYFNISWPVADTIYYAHFSPTFADDGLITYGSQVERMHLPEATVELLAPGAAWPRVSSDGAMLAYVTDANELILAESTGANPKSLLEPDSFSAVDAPLFSPDNSMLCFSAVEQVSASLPSLLSRLLGLKIAYAHNVPSDWYCMPLDGSGEAVRLTNLDGLGLYGDFSADGRYLAFMTSAGIYVIKTDGSDLRQVKERGLVGTLNWEGFSKVSPAS